MTSTPPRAGGGRALVGIGEVMALLRPEFPDVSVSKIRFLEAEGLVEPQRTPSGYRKFGPTDLDRLRYVLRAQRDQYLPLKVIKDHLDAIDRGLEPAEDGLGAASAAADASPPAPVYFTRAELLAAAGIDDAALTRLEEFGLIEARRVVEVAGPEAGVRTPAPRPAFRRRGERRGSGRRRAGVRAWARGRRWCGGWRGRRRGHG
ncbi:transcriptional regulator FtsR [Yinghuangia aomiensis]